MNRDIEIFQTSGGYVYLFDGDANLLVFVTISGLSPAPVEVVPNLRKTAKVDIEDPAVLKWVGGIVAFYDALMKV